MKLNLPKPTTVAEARAQLALRRAARGDVAGFAEALAGPLEKWQIEILRARPIPQMIQWARRPGKATYHADRVRALLQQVTR